MLQIIDCHIKPGEKTEDRLKISNMADELAELLGLEHELVEGLLTLLKFPGKKQVARHDLLGVGHAVNLIPLELGYYHGLMLLVEYRPYMVVYTLKPDDYACSVLEYVELHQAEKRAVSEGLLDWDTLPMFLKNTEFQFSSKVLNGVVSIHGPTRSEAFLVPELYNAKMPAIQATCKDELDYDFALKFYKDKMP